MESDSDTSAIVTTKIPFDGKGHDPQSLVGRKIKWYYKSGKGISLLTFLFQKGQNAQFVNDYEFVVYEEGITENNDPSWFHFDANLKAALGGLSRGGRTTRLIEEACVGERSDGKRSWRVIGIKCEGMTEMGYIYCKKEATTQHANFLDPDDSDIEWVPESHEDVILAASRIRY